MNRFISWLALAATLSILGCKTTESDTVAPVPGPHVAEVTRFKPEAAKQPVVAPNATDAIQPPASPSEVPPRIAPIMLRNLGEESVEKTSEARTVGDTRNRRALSASTPTQEVVSILATLEAMPHAVVSFLGAVRAHRTEATTPRDAVTPVEASAASPDRARGLGDGFWSYATPALTGLCVYILAPLLVDLLKQRIQVTRRGHDAGKPAQAA